MPPHPVLPIDAVMPEVVAALCDHGRLVLQAPPGAGKTTRVPLALLDRVPGRIVMLEPRRIAARAAADRMARTLGEAVGQTVGYRIRGESVVGPTTRIEVVTEGILTRRLQSDPSLEGVGAVLFDEVHERSLNADLGLALVLEARSALRPDLRVGAMSATLDAAPLAVLMDNAPIVTAQGTTHPVETCWRDRPLPPGARLEAEVAAQILDALQATAGGVLVFLPGEREIRRVAAALQGRVPAGCHVCPLYGALPLAAQRAAIAPARDGRKVVLATAIAETSLTIEDVRVVVDAGRARRARFDPASGMSRLVTERVSRAEADQRRGRAGRVAPGVCFRMWTRGEEGALAARPPAEIEAADLTSLALELAVWGAPLGEGLAFLTPPPEGALREARGLLTALGALDRAGRVTDHGRAMAALPLHPRLAHMLLQAGRSAAPLAALLGGRDPLRGGPVDLSLRLAALKGRTAAPEGLVAPIRDEAARLGRLVPRETVDRLLSEGEMVSLAYPDRIGLRRAGVAPRWLLAGGKGAVMDAGDPMAEARLIVVSDLDGDPREARIRQAAAVSEDALRRLHGDRIVTVPVCTWAGRDRCVRARIETRLDALVLGAVPWPDAPPEALALAALEGVRSLGLEACGMGPAARRLQARMALLRNQGEDLPDVSDSHLLDTAEAWLLPFLTGCRTAADLASLDLSTALLGRLDWTQRALLDRLAPAEFVTPLGRRVPIDYGQEQPSVALRLQELLGCDRHPVVGPGRTPLRLTLLSPAGRPLQVTTDLPGFWRNAYGEVRKEMRGRYPRHPWPEDPAAATPTLRAKPRGT
ncbi:MAG: ATP-dependent helicase HrpB [Alkalilacustris sp.]